MLTIQNNCSLNEYTNWNPSLLQESSLFFDIETTGFSRNHCKVYLIGCMYRKADTLCFIQWFSENNADEKQLLICFSRFIQNFQQLIHFNGNNFDIPFLQARCEKYGLTESIDSLTSIDLYREIYPYRTIFPLNNFKQKSFEQYFGIAREDLYDGKQLIQIYQDYTISPQKEALQLLLLHNFEDLKGMVPLSALHSYYETFQGNIKNITYEKNNYQDENQNQQTELLFHFQLQNPLPVPISFSKGNIHFILQKNLGTISVPVYVGECKCYFKNYKDYYYLPKEDTAIHKSVATFVDKEYREPAKASNCYTKVISEFIPQFQDLYQPIWRKNNPDNTFYFPIEQLLDSDALKIKHYIQHLLTLPI